MIAGDALGCVDGGCVAVVEPPGCEVAAVEHDLLTARQRDVRAGGVDVGEVAAHPVVDRELGSVREVLASVVASQDDVLARCVRSSTDRNGSFEIELARVGEGPSGEEVELVGFGAGAGEHQRGAVGSERVPVGDRALAECETVVVEHDPTVRPVCGEGCDDIAVAELIERCLLPRGVLTPVDGELGDAVTKHVECGSEASAGGDFGELVVIADEDELGAGPCHLIHDTGEIAHRGHAGLIHDDHGASVDVAVLDEVAGQCGRVDPGAGFEFAGGAC